VIKLPYVYKEIMDEDNSYVLLYGGRLGGKSKGTAIMAILNMLSNPYTDIIVARVSYGSMADSSFAEFESAIADFGNYKDEFTLKKSPLRIEREGDSGTIYFLGYGGANTSRTKSIKTRHPIQTVILEETQELKSKRNLDEAMASFRRNFGRNAKVYVLGNPPPIKSHWFNEFIEEKKLDTDWTCKNVTYLDILPFINDFDLKEILKAKIQDPEYYKWFYLGEPSGGFGTCYPMFRREKSVISPNQFEQCLERGLRIVGCVIGGDGAVNRDSTAFVPLILLSNGQVAVGEIFYHNPKDDAVVGYHYLVQNLLLRWLDKILRMYRLGTIEDKRSGRNVLPVWMRVDNAAPDLIAECRYFFGDRIDVNPIRKPHIVEMVSVCQSAIMNENVTIIDNGKYFDYYQNREVKSPNVLVTQIESLIWNERQNGYDPIVPNDVCDAWTYGTYFWYSNQENIQFFNQQKLLAKQNRKIRDIINDKEK